VAEIKQSCCFADGVVFGEVRGLAHGHLPARKISEARSCLSVQLVQWSLCVAHLEPPGFGDRGVSVLAPPLSLA